MNRPTATGESFHETFSLAIVSSAAATIVRLIAGPVGAVVPDSEKLAVGGRQAEGGVR